MRNLKDAKDIYDHIVVPEELDGRLKKALDNAVPKKSPSGTLLHFSKWAGSAAAAILLSFTIGLNTSQSFAMEMSQLPVISHIAKVLTIRSYEAKNENTTTTVEIPEVQLETTATSTDAAITDINAKIQTLVEDYTARKHKEISEYKDLFLENGGTLEEWEERSIDINVNYQVLSQSDTTLSLLIDSWISWFNFEEERKFYNIDLQTGEELILTDILGEDAYSYATEQVRQQMEKLCAEQPDVYTFWGIGDEKDSEIAFPGVTAETSFYINADGNIVISYNKYDAAPGYLGIQEFMIPKR